MSYPERKTKLLTTFLEAFTRFDQVIVVDLMNISTEQIVKTRVSLRNENGVVLIGKNTIAKLAIKILTTDDDPKAEYYEQQKKYGKKHNLAVLSQHIKGKLGFVFCDKSYVELKNIIEKEKIKMPAKAGVIAPVDVVIPAGPTFLDPGRIGEFQRLGIQTKINKNAIEINKDFKICGKGEIVSETCSSMCRLLNIIPFEYAMALKTVLLNGQIIPEELIQMGSDDILASFQRSVKDVTAVCLEAGLPNALSLPHMIRNTFKTLLAVGLEANLKFKELDAALNAQSTGGPPAQGQKATTTTAAKVEAAPEPEEEEVDMDMGDLFG
jgi:large subunit ribosomal protein LP0